MQSSFVGKMDVSELASIAAASEPATSTMANVIVPGTAAWYLVHTKPRQEDVVLANLQRQAYECYLPAMRVERVKRRKAEIATEPMFHNGDSVVVTDGPFAGIEAIYQTSDAERRRSASQGGLIRDPVRCAN